MPRTNVVKNLAVHSDMVKKSVPAEDNGLLLELLERNHGTTGITTTASTTTTGNTNIDIDSIINMKESFPSLDELFQEFKWSKEEVCLFFESIDIFGHGNWDMMVKKVFPLKNVKEIKIVVKILYDVKHIKVK